MMALSPAPPLEGLHPLKGETQRQLWHLIVHSHRQGTDTHNLVNYY